MFNAHCTMMLLAALAVINFGCDDGTSQDDGGLFPDAQPREVGAGPSSSDAGRSVNTIKDAEQDDGGRGDAAGSLDGQVAPECVPGTERCNGRDDDCDGETDESDPDLSQPCDMDLPGACNLGALSCQNGTLECTQTVEPMPEVCDEADNDCDGVSDENLGGEPCDTGAEGACAAGLRVCEAGGYRCEANSEPAEEQCNSVDDDCNGQVDDIADGVLCGCAEERPTVRVQAECGGGGYQPTQHIGMCAEETELHIVGQYTSADDADRESLVRISRLSLPMVLVLSSYDPTRWRLELAAGVRITQIIINGYEPSELINPPADVEVVNLTGPGRYLSACAYTWPGDDQGCDTPGLVRGAEQRIGLPITTFQGCYSGAGFVIEDQAPN